MGRERQGLEKLLSLYEQGEGGGDRDREKDVEGWVVEKENRCKK